MPDTVARFRLGEVVRHRVFPFRGVIFDVDPEFANSEEWWQSIPEDMRPRKDQPYYHLLAENEDETKSPSTSRQSAPLTVTETVLPDALRQSIQ